ncbi:MAG: NUDIX domain-containing protein, partial [Patescibacteria group bacterium]
VLLAKKVRKIGAGCLNGYGGGVEPGDATLIDAALREFTQETGGLMAKAADLVKVAVVDFHNRTVEGIRFTCRVHVYLLYGLQGQAKTTEEMADPAWFSKNALPLGKLMPADPYWLPRILAGEFLYVKAWYGPAQKTLEKAVQVTPVTPNELDRL